MCISSSNPDRSQGYNSSTMRPEVDSAAEFLVNILRLNERSKRVDPQVLELFKARLIECLKSHYTDHWFPEIPYRGSGYRCIRINGKLDPVISKAGKLCGLPDTFLYSLFPAELTLWVDPKEVSYRIGENGSICVLYATAIAASQPSDSDSSTSSSPINLPSDPRPKLVFCDHTKNQLGMFQQQQQAIGAR